MLQVAGWFVYNCRDLNSAGDTPRCADPAGSFSYCGACGKSTQEKILMKKIALTLLAVAFLASMAMAKSDKAPKAKSEKMSGWIADAKCASAKGSHADHAACSKKCIEGGEKAVFVTDNDNKVLAIDNQDAVKGHEGHHVKVSAHVTGESIHVDKVSMIKEKATEQKGEHKSGM
jgi:hypothetical protein